MKTNTNLTIEDVAREAKVSISTVSRAINSETRKKVASATLRKIDRIVKKYGYAPNFAARTLRAASTKTIGVIFPAFAGIFSNTYYINIFSGISDFFLDTEYKFKIIPLKGGQVNPVNYDFRAAEGVDGLIAAHWPHFFSHQDVLALDIPCVFLNDYEENLPVYCCGGDQFTGGKVAARYLLEQGHKKIGLITGEEKSSDSRLRVLGFTNYLKAHGIVLPESAVVCGNYHEDEAYKLADSFIAKNPGLTAIFCCNDEMAIGFIRRLEERGINCPGQISIMGYDNIARAGSFSPGITTIEEPLYQIAREGARILVDYLKAGDFSRPLAGERFFPPALIKRESVKTFS